MKQEHNKPGELNFYTLDTDSVITAYGKHARVVAFLPKGGQLECRVDIRDELREPTASEVLTVARKNQGLRGRWNFSKREPWPNDSSRVDFIFTKA